jgi:Methyltransferase domain
MIEQTNNRALTRPVRKLRKTWARAKEKLQEQNSVQRWFARKMLPVTQTLGFSICGDHFYEPIPNVDLIRTTYVERTRTLRGFCPEFPWADDATDLLSTFLPEYLSSQTYLKYGKKNWFYSGWDAAYYYCLIRSRKPRSITEIGGGFSTSIAADALQQNAREGRTGEIVSIDPYFRGNKSASFARIMTCELQKLDVEQRRSLLGADILFIDSSHVLKWGSDVFHLFEAWIPYVPVNTLVHVHDVFTPFDYPKHWMVQAKRFWNEQYILESFLALNNSFRILCPIHYLSAMGQFKDVAERLGHTELKTATGSAMWLERIA